jgi:hypothetical protein
MMYGEMEDVVTRGPAGSVLAVAGPIANDCRVLARHCFFVFRVVSAAEGGDIVQG